jgi:hypothetical protein
MADFREFDSFSNKQIRELAKQKMIPGAAKLDPWETFSLLRRLQALETKPKTELLALLKGYEIKHLREMPKKHLALLALQADRYNQASQAELHRIARNAGLSLSHFEKMDIVKKLLTNYAAQLRAEASLVEHETTPSKKAGDIQSRAIKVWIGSVVRLCSVVGIVLGFSGMLLAPIFVARVSSWVDERTLSFAKETARLADSLRQTGSVLASGLDTLESTEATIQNIEASIEDTGSLIDSTASLIGDQAPEVIDDTRSAMLSAEEGARAVDQVLRALAKLNFLTGITYDPAQPLDEAIADVASSLEPLPDDLRRVGDGLSQAYASFGEVNLSLSDAGDALNGFSEELAGKDELLTDLATDLDSLSEGVADARGSIGSVIWIGVILFELLLIVHVAGQLTIYYMGGVITSNPPES